MRFFARRISEISQKKKKFGLKSNESEFLVLFQMINDTYRLKKEKFMSRQNFSFKSFMYFFQLFGGFLGELKKIHKRFE